LVLPAAFEGAAEPPPTAKPLAVEPPTVAEPLSLPCQVHFEGFLALVVDTDMIKLRGNIDNISVVVK
jgi:hypothetical protein